MAIFKVILQKLPILDPPQMGGIFGFVLLTQTFFTGTPLDWVETHFSAVCLSAVKRLKVQKNTIFWPMISRAIILFTACARIVQ